jgi:hypothetical protein
MLLWCNTLPGCPNRDDDNVPGGVWFCLVVFSAAKLASVLEERSGDDHGNRDCCLVVSEAELVRAASE